MRAALAPAGAPLTWGEKEARAEEEDKRRTLNKEANVLQTGCDGFHNAT